MAKKPKRKKESLPEDLDAFATRLDKDSDRGAALVAAALLDAQLENLFQRRLRAHQDSLLINNGPLSTFASRIKVASALGWIDEDVEADLNLIRDIRNRLAHSFDHNLGFSDPQIAGWCTSLRTTNAHLLAFDRAKDRLHKSFGLEVIAAWRALLEPPRNRYLMTTHFIAQHLKELVETGRSEEGLVASVVRLAETFEIKTKGVGAVP
jgi:DNA-binding MltR family transcriptional regulator